MDFSKLLPRIFAPPASQFLKFFTHPTIRIAVYFSPRLLEYISHQIGLYKIDIGYRTFF